MECGEGRPGAVRGASPTLGPCREGCCAPRRGGGRVRPRPTPPGPSCGRCCTGSPCRRSTCSSGLSSPRTRAWTRSASCCRSGPGSGASGAAGRRAFPRVHSGWVPGAQAPPHPDPSSLGAVATVRAEAGASAAWRGLRGAPFLLVALWTGTVSGTVRRFPHGPDTLSWPSEAKPALGQTPLVCGMAPDSASPDGAGLRGEQGGESVW